MVAEIFRASAAVFASAIRLMQPGNPYSRSDGESLRAFPAFLDDADNLVPGNHW